MKTFITTLNDIKTRLDTDYYQPIYTELEEKVTKDNSAILSDYIENLSGGATPSSKKKDVYYTDNPNEGIPFIRVQNLSQAGLKVDDVKYITPLVHNGMLQRSQSNGGDLLVKITGVGRMAVSSVVPENYECNINQHIVRIKTKDRKTSEVLATYLNTDIGEKLASRRSTGGTRPALDYEALKSIPIVFDPKIVDIMQSAYQKKQELEQEAERLLNSFEENFNNTTNYKFPRVTQKRVFQTSLSDLDGAINPERYAKEYKEQSPENWVYISEIGEVILSSINPKSLPFDNKVSILRIDDLPNNPQEAVIREVYPKEIAGQMQKVNPGDILIARLLPTIINKKIIIVPDISDTILASNEFICLRTTNYNANFLLHILKSDFYTSQMIQKSRGATPSRQRLSREDFATFRIPRVDVKNQNLLSEKMKQNIDNAIAMKQESIEIVKQAKAQVEKIILGNNEE